MALTASICPSAAPAQSPFEGPFWQNLFGTRKHDRHHHSGSYRHHHRTKTPTEEPDAGAQREAPLVGAAGAAAGAIEGAAAAAAAIEPNRAPPAAPDRGNPEPRGRHVAQERVAQEGCESGQRIISSFYSLPGRTATGERFNPYGMTAAHRTLPFGTRITVTNPRTGQSVVVIINDRGPFVRGVTLDLSLGAARAIGLKGNGSVCMS